MTNSGDISHSLVSQIDHKDGRVKIAKCLKGNAFESKFLKIAKHYFQHDSYVKIQNKTKNKNSPFYLKTGTKMM